MTASTGGFVDLRVHRATESSHSDDSIWPSFTDIMMVVVMIFLMASVIFMIRNLQLGEDIQRASQAESQALEESVSLRERALYLSEIIEQTKQELSLTEDRRAEFEALSEARGLRISELEIQTADLYQTQQRLNAEVAALNDSLNDIRGERDTLTDRISSMNLTIADLNTLIDSRTGELNSLQADFLEKQDQLLSLEEQLTERGGELDNLQAALAGMRALEADLREQIALLEEVKSDSELQIQNLIAESGLKDEQIARLSESARQQSDELAARLTELETLEQAHRESLASIETLRADLFDRDAELENLKLASAQLQGVVAQLQTVKAEQGQTIESQIETQAQLRESLTRREAEVLELEREQARIRLELDSALGELQAVRLSSAALSESQLADIAELTETQAESNLTIERQQQELASLQALYAERLAELDQIETDYIERERELARTKSQLDSALGELQQVRVSSAALSESQLADIAELTEAQAESNLTIERQQQELASLQALYAERLVELDQVEADYIERERELARTKSQLDSVLDELQQVRLSSAALSESQLADIARLTDSQTQDTRTIERQEQELSSLRTLYDERLAELAQIESDFIERERELARLQEQLASTVSLLDSAQQNLLQRDTEIQSLNVQVAALGDEVEVLASTDEDSKSTIKQLLDEKIKNQNQILQQRQQLVSLEQDVQRMRIENDALTRELSFSRQLQADRQQQIETLQTVMAQLSSDLKSRDERLEGLQAEKEQLFQTGVRTDQEILELRQAYQERLAELSNLQSALASRSGEVEQLQGEIVELKEERQLMLRPARSPVNRYVVEIFYTKSDAGDFVYQYRLPDERSATNVSRAELESLLERLMNERPEGLYTKVIFPDENQLTFSEAWNFTQYIQANYDYYSNQ